jgi:hypothetical protein
MQHVQIQVAALVMILITSGSVGAQVPSGQCDQTSTSCSLSSQPNPIGALSSAHQEAVPRVSVTFDGKLLSVQAHGASLRSILAVIGNRTGTEIDFGGAGSDASGVYVEMGPATVRDLLRDLLNGSHLNYVMLRSKLDPGFVERLVILGSEHDSTGVDRQSPTVVTAQPAQPKLYGGGFSGDPQEDGSNPIVPTPTEPPPAALPTVAAQPPTLQPSVDPSIAKYQQQYQQALADAASSGKSRAQIIDELQKLQQKELDDQYSQSQPH